MIRRLWKTLKLGFDRSFSGASWKQITWLFGILALVLGFSLWIKSYCTAELHDMRILELLLDPGSFVLQDGDPLGYERLPLLALTFLGAIFFTGGLISVVSNILTGRIARFRQGEIRYRFDGHIVLLGANDTAAGLIRELHAEPENRRRDIVLLTQSDAEALRRKLHAELSPAEERRLIILHGQRDSREALEKIHIHRAARGGGQILLVTAGRGWYQEWGEAPRALRPGDVVNIPPNVKHWHGAATDSWFAHLAFEVPSENASNEWLEPVTDEEYGQLDQR